jgi:hypothetical protein
MYTFATSATRLTSPAWGLDVGNVDETCSLFVRRLARPLGVDAGGGVRGGEEADEEGLTVDGLQTILDFGEEALCDVVGEHDLAIGLVVGHGGVRARCGVGIGRDVQLPRRRIQNLILKV